MVQKLVTARSRIDFGLNKADEVALNFETIYRGRGNYFERMENLGPISMNFDHSLCIANPQSYDSPVMISTEVVDFRYQILKSEIYETSSKWRKESSSMEFQAFRNQENFRNRPK